MSEQIWIAIIAAIPPTFVAFWTKREVGRVHTLVNSQKTEMEARLTSALAKILELKADLQRTLEALDTERTRP